MSSIFENLKTSLHAFLKSISNNSTSAANVSEAVNATSSGLPPLPPVLLFNGHDFELYLSYFMLGLMAVIPIYFGSWAAVHSLQAKEERRKHKKDGQLTDDDIEEENEYFSLDDAKWFPLIGSATLLSLYLLFKFFNREYLNYLITAYFSILGVGALTKAMLAVLRKATGARILGDYRLDLFRHGNEILSTHFSHTHLVLVGVSTLLSVYYAISKHWIVSNLYGLAFATTAVQLLNLDSFLTGMILLAGLFFYDVFWVFGTDVMVTVAKSFDAPIKVVWPKDLISSIVHRGLLETLSNTKGMQFTMLGLGDIVIPGIFVALCLRFDFNNFKKLVKSASPTFNSVSHPYFAVNFLLYSLGLVATVFVMHTFKAAQPALLYLSPSCILGALFVAYFKGQLGELFSYKEGPQEENSVEKEAPKVAVKKQKPAKKVTKAQPKATQSKQDEPTSEAKPAKKGNASKKKKPVSSESETTNTGSGSSVSASLRVTGTPGKALPSQSKGIVQAGMFDALSNLDENNKRKK